MPDSAFKVHGLSAEFLTGKALFGASVDEFLAFIGDDPLVIHNAEFDMRFINAELERIGRPGLSKNSIVDTLTLARRKHPGASNSLDALCGRYGIDTSRRTKHGALVDSEILAEVYMELKGGRQITMTLPVQVEERIIVVQKVLNARPAALPARLTSAEAQAHDEFIDKLPKRAVWSLYGSLIQT
jgi:DNA polymerase-3 subunit epsilon